MPSRLVVLFASLLVGCGPSSEPREHAELKGDARYEECSESDAELMLAIRVQPGNTKVPESVETYFLHKVDCLGLSSTGGHSSNSHGVDEHGNFIYTQRAADLFDIKLHKAKFESSYATGIMGNRPETKYNVEILVPLDEDSETHLDDGSVITVETSRLSPKQIAR